jgi:transposase
LWDVRWNYHQRDLNASKNILKQGINILSGYGIESDIKQKQEEALPLGESVIPEAKPSLVVW